MGQMIETAIYSRLASDAALAGTVTVFSGAPAIFSEFAPETAQRPYVVFRVMMSSADAVVRPLTVMVDYYEYNTSRVKSRLAAERIEYLLDQQVVQDADYADIRLNYFAGSPVDAGDGRDIQYNVQFSGRATRKKWIIQNH